MTVVEHLRTAVELLPALAKFAFGMALIVVIPRSRGASSFGAVWAASATVQKINADQVREK